MSTYSLPGYDAWATAGPPEHVWVCPKCGHDSEDMEEVLVIGLTATAVFKCPGCDNLVADGAFVTADEFHRP